MCPGVLVRPGSCLSSGENGGSTGWARNCEGPSKDRGSEEFCNNAERRRSRVHGRERERRAAGLPGVRSSTLVSRGVHHRLRGVRVSVAGTSSERRRDGPRSALLSRAPGPAAGSHAEAACQGSKREDRGINGAGARKPRSIQGIEDLSEWHRGEGVCHLLRRASSKGSFYSNFYGGLLVRSSDLEHVRERVHRKKLELHLHDEVKWQKGATLTLTSTSP